MSQGSKKTFSNNEKKDRARRHKRRIRGNGICRVVKELQLITYQPYAFYHTNCTAREFSDARSLISKP